MHGSKLLPERPQPLVPSSLCKLLSHHQMPPGGQVCYGPGLSGTDGLCPPECSRCHDVSVHLEPSY